MTRGPPDGEVQRTAASEIVLLVDDDVQVGSVVGRFLEANGYTVLHEATGAAALATFQRESPDVVVLDIGLPDKSGLDVLEELRDENAVVILLTGQSDVATAVMAMQRGAENFLTKPVELPHLAAAMARAVEKVRLRREVRHLRGRVGQPGLDGILGVSPAMRTIEREMAAVAASPRTTVLIVGESGTGKGRAAQAIHGASARADRPFVAINCASLTETFLDDELFGHERGAFTGAQDRKVGLFELAHGGTAFLDEIGELALGLQPKLLTALETRRFRRLGGTNEIATDVRLIAATNRDIERAVAEGTLREDLYYRLAVSIVHLPPLRERPREDVMHLIQNVLAELTDEVPGAPTDVSDRARERLLAYAWPGNAREVRNVLERGMIMARGSPAIGVEHLPPDVRRRTGAVKGRPPETLEETERRQIADVLRLHGGNRTHSARALGVSRVTLLKKIRKYGLE